MSFVEQYYKGAIKIMTVPYSLVDHDFIWTLPLIKFCQMLTGAWRIIMQIRLAYWKATTFKRIHITIT